MRRWRGLLVLLLALTAHTAMAQRAPLHQSFDLRVPCVPTPVIVAGKAGLVYELHLASYAQEPLTLRRIEVIDDHQQVLLDLSGAALAEAIGRADRAKGDDRLRIAPGMTAVACLSVPVTSTVATRLGHRVTYDDAASRTATIEGAPLTSRPPASQTLGPPLRGGPWVAIYDSDSPEHWFGYGADVLAVADAAVASIGEGVAEPASLKEGAAHNVPLENAAGNYIALDLGDGRYAFYEHLKPGSITVKPGQRVRRGEVIGKLGFTGESTGPHLHFHVSDANAPLDAEGLPYALSSFRILGAYASIEDFAEGRPWASQATPAVGDGFPAPLSVVDFGDGR